MNPELRQTLNTLSHNFEHANQAAQENIYTFTQLYIDPCLAGFKGCLQDCTAPCFPNREDSVRRRRGRARSRGQAEYFFDFYDDWNEDEDINVGSQAWGNDELDSLLAGRGEQPKRQRGMSYGSKNRRRPGPMQPSDAEEDPTLIPGSSYLGFLERLPFKIGARVLKYRPSAANLQEHPSVHRSAAESQPLLEDDGYGTVSDPSKKGHMRQRSSTQNSRATTNSLSSRGDLILSDEEEDAVPLDDEFAVMLSRRMTNSEESSGKTGLASGKQKVSRRSTNRTASTKSARSSNHSTPSKRSRSQRSRNFTSPNPTSPSVEVMDPFPSMQELRREEDDVRKQEEMEIQQKREAAQRLAAQSGLDSSVKEAATKSAATVSSDAVEEDDGRGETRSMTDIDDTDIERNVEDLAASRDTLSSQPDRASSPASFQRPGNPTLVEPSESPDPP
ncbi:uncharacterized protein HMPREF1541_06879 [Cyphellophora europaea CBS 101466]|uniref:Uncharacterized protein n=1 Tax=Cyphellophora europaea (strain CBS 101466) TaxID=1220924 RepID=W2RSZ1_CYPE1|nr:uncharacterized protein HMPREF1541_06879 [Cyphellophora europaea CBS 101466]ETN38839.1 hypothetical protein HMPREF1541_06879 [Cyphellophora europaea CBS 101466]